MSTPWTLIYAYLAYGLAVLLAVVSWLGGRLQGALYGRAGDGRLDEIWLELAHWLAQYLRFFTIAGGVLTLCGLILAALSSGEPAEVTASHRGYLLRFAAIAFAALCLGYVGQGDLSKYYLDLAAAVLCGWALWVIVAGARALAGGAAVAGPALWWLGLVVVLLLFVRLVVLLFFVSPDNPNQF
ncbi:hypothetical protein AAFN88_11855 [Pelagibius sp. CAU 1746]|uniref:hypothetical protein n=1 Tax=Pelagibius sp. CAU 1746 TaxID=3140370 RepID=UPI00325B9DF3